MGAAQRGPREHAQRRLRLDRLARLAQHHAVELGGRLEHVVRRARNMGLRRLRKSSNSSSEPVIQASATASAALSLPTA